MATQSLPQEQDKPNGPVAAALLAGGLGAATIGLLTTLADASAAIKNALNWYNPVGPLMGKSLVGVIVFFASWIVLGLIFRGKNLNFARVAVVALILLAVGLLGTFPPFFDIFAAQ